MASSEGALFRPAASWRQRLPINPIFRKLILTATHNRVVARLVRKYGMRLGAGRFVAGETLDEAVVVLRGLNQQGLRANTTLLGEGVRDEATAAGVVAEYVKVLDRIGRNDMGKIVRARIREKLLAN